MDNRMVFPGLQIGAKEPPLLAHRNLLQRMENQRHSGMRRDRFSGEGVLGFSLGDDFARAAFWQCRICTLFDDPFPQIDHGESCWITRTGRFLSGQHPIAAQYPG